MKKILFAFVLLLVSISCFSQEKPQLKKALQFGINGAFWGSGDALGMAIYGEYVFPVNEHLSIVPKLESGTTNGSRLKTHEDKSVYDHEVTNAMATSISCRITPFQNAFNRFSFDIGLLYHKWADSSNYNSWNYLDGYRPNPMYRVERSIGILGAINLAFYENENVVSGFKAEMQTGFYGTSIECLSVQAGIFMGVRF